MRVLAKVFSILTVLVLAGVSLPGCTSANHRLPNVRETTLAEQAASKESFPTPTLPAPITPLDATPESLSIVRPGIYTAHNVEELPLPTAGYQIYLIGEIHGIAEVHQLTIAYLKMLHAAGLRDVFLEESQGYEKDANKFVSGETGVLITGLCLRSDVLEGIRAFNQTLPPNEEVRVHLVELDSTPTAVYTHLLDIQHRLGASAQNIVIPSFGEFQHWREADMTILVDRLGNAPGVTSQIRQELDTIRDSIRWVHAVSMDDYPIIAPPEIASMREARITQNIQHLLADLEDKPVLALYGGFHAQKKANKTFGQTTPWAQRLSEKGIKIYALFAAGMYGTAYWRGQTSSQGIQPDELLFLPPEGVSLEVLLGDSPDYAVVYIDLHSDTAANLIWFSGNRISDRYDGLILFREFSPMVDACP